jgi:hypothetical protein
MRGKVYYIMKERRQKDVGVTPPKGGYRMTTLEVFGLLMLIIAVINLVIKFTKKK